VARRAHRARRSHATRPPAPSPAGDALRDPAPVLAQGTALLRGSVAGRRRALRVWPGGRRPVADHVIVLLAHGDLHADALAALRRVAPAITGQLVDALLDPAMDFVVRRRIPRALAVCTSQRAVAGLLEGLRDERFEVRLECGRALSKITQRDPRLVVARAAILEAILLEREKSVPLPPTGLEVDPDDDERDLVKDLLVRDRVDRSLEHVFTILSLILEREPLRIAFQALHHADVRHRGTALEYLQTVLPSRIRKAVWPLLGGASALSHATPATEVLAELLDATPEGSASGAAAPR
jgi:ATP:ADP antiporter, AAA family